MRIVTRPDFDGVVCAVLLIDAEDVSDPVQWVEPGDMKNGLIRVRHDDIIANLPHGPGCALWFDHHYTNKIDIPFKGAFREAPSAAGIIFEYYRGKFQRDYRQLVKAADKIDAADLTLDEVQRPEAYDYVLVSMTVSNQNDPDEAYWNHLVELFRHHDIDRVLADPLVDRRCRKVIEENKVYKDHLLNHTQVDKHVAITDLRSFKTAPIGNRFLVYSLFPDAFVHVRIRRDPKDAEKLVVNVGHSIFNPDCRVNVGQLLSHYEGGGHPGAGSCRFHVSKSDQYIPAIIAKLQKNDAAC